MFIGLKQSTSFSGDITFFITSSSIPFGNGLKVNIPCTEESLFDFSKASIYCSWVVSSDNSVTSATIPIVSHFLRAPLS